MKDWAGKMWVRIVDVYNKHKTEMILVAAAGFVLGRLTRYL